MNTGAGIQFQSDGPIMSGTWYNPQNGHKFTVRDCFFQDGQFIVMTMDGQTLDYNTIQNYVQVTDANGAPAEPDASLMAPKQEQALSNLPPEVAALVEPATPGEEFMTPEDAALTKGLGNLHDARHIAPAEAHQASGPHFQGYMQVVEPIDQDLAMVDRVLRRHPIPELDAQLKWACPEKQIETLIDVLGIEPDVIAQYYASKLDKDAIFEGIKRKLSAYITENWGPKITTSTTATTIEPETAPTERPKTPARPKNVAKPKK